MLKLRGSDIRRRFKAYGLPLDVSWDLSREILKWQTNSGPAWTVSRLKDLKLDFVRMRAGLEPLTWVRRNRRGRWFGCFGRLLDLAFRNDKNFRMVINCLMVYSAYMPKKPTEQHIQKMLSSIEGEKVFIPSNLVNDISHHAKSILGIQKLAPPVALASFQGKTGRKAPIYKGASVPQDQFLEKELDWITGNPYHESFVIRHWKCYKPVIQCLDADETHELRRTFLAGMFANEDVDTPQAFGPFMRPPSYPNHPVAGGKLVPLTKDGGWKVRWIASPFRLHQLALAPLGTSLFNLIEKLPWDCTHNQEKPYPHIQRHLQAGGTAYAVDLSSATDHFPLELQVGVLNALFDGAPHVQLFEELSRASWACDEINRPVRWSNGQPMGLYPSFPSFALTHGLLLDYLSGGKPNSFFVLGDDVVILDTKTYEAYVKTLQVLGCPHDHHKTIASSELTEFAGKIITKHEVISAFKWRSLNADNFLDLMRNFGQPFRLMLRRRERAVYDSIARLLLPVGCNHSQGSAEPLEVVVQKTELFLQQLVDRPVGRALHSSFFHFLSSNLQAFDLVEDCFSFLQAVTTKLIPSRDAWSKSQSYCLSPQGKSRKSFKQKVRDASLYWKLSLDWVKDEDRALVERVSRAFSNSPFALLRRSAELRSLLGYLGDILEEPLTCGIPGLKGRPSSLTVLETYEKHLGISEKPIRRS